MRRVSGTGTATASAGGDATVFINGPFRPLSWWRLTSVVLRSTKPATSYPTASVYRAVVAPSGLLGFSRSADEVTFEAQEGDLLLPGEQLIVVFAGVSPATRVVVNLTAIEYDDGTPR